MSELLEDLPGSHSLASYDKLQHLDDENGNIEGEIEREMKSKYVKDVGFGMLCGHVCKLSAHGFIPIDPSVPSPGRWKVGLKILTESDRLETCKYPWFK